MKNDIDVGKGSLTSQQILRKTGLMNTICNMAYPSSDASTKNDHMQCVQLHSQILKLGISLKNALDNLESLGTTIEERVRKDKQKARVTAAMQAHSQFSQHVAKLEKFKTDSEVLSAAKTLTDQGTESEEAQHVQALFLDVDSAAAFQKVVESEMVFDTVSRHVVTHNESIHLMVVTLEKAISKVTGEHSWKRGLVSSDPIESVLDLGASSLLKMDMKGASFKSFLDDFGKDLYIGEGPCD